MMKKLLCTLLAITTVASLTACKKTDGKQEKDTDTVYLPSEKVSYTEDGQVLSKTTYEYDAKGRLLTTIVDIAESEPIWNEELQVYISELHPCDGQPNIIEEYAYDDRGNVTTYTYQTLEDGQWETEISYKYSYTYSESGKISAFRQYHTWGDTTTDREFTLEYTDGTPTKLWCKEVGSDKDPQLIGDYSYNENNLLCECKLTEIGSSGPLQYTYAYDSQHRLTAFVGRYPNQEPQFDLRFTYDGDGNLLSEECTNPQYQRFRISYSYNGDILTGVSRNDTALFDLDENGCAIRPTGESYEYHYTTMELRKEDAQNLRYIWNQSHRDNTSGLVSSYCAQWSPYFVAVKQPLHEIGPMLPSYL